MPIIEIGNWEPYRRDRDGYGEIKLLAYLQTWMARLNDKYTAIIAGSYPLHVLVECRQLTKYVFRPNDIDIWVNCANVAELVMAAYDFSKEHPKYRLDNIRVEHLPKYEAEDGYIQGIVEMTINTGTMVEKKMQLICWKDPQVKLPEIEKKLALSVIKQFDISIVKIAIIKPTDVGSTFFVENTSLPTEVITGTFRAEMREWTKAKTFFARVDKYRRRGFRLAAVKGTDGTFEHMMVIANFS